MEEYKFKTNINCGGCVASVTPHLEKAEIKNWNVDTSDPDKVLTVHTDQLTGQEVAEIVSKAGFKAEQLQ